MDPYVGKYFSTQYIHTEILGQTETQIEELDAQMADDIKSGKALDPLDVTALEGEKIDAESDNLAMDKELKQAQIKQAKNLRSFKTVTVINKVSNINYSYTRTRNR